MMSSTCTDSKMYYRTKSIAFISLLQDCTHNLRTAGSAFIISYFFLGFHPKSQKFELPFSEKQNQSQESTA